MGFINNLKNYITGSAAKVGLAVDDPARGKPFTVTVTAETGETPCRVSKVYLHVRATEHVEIPNVEVAKRSGEALEAHRQTVQHDETTYQEQIEVAPATELQPRQQYRWDVEVNLPPEVPPSFTGRHARHEWKLLAGLDMRGNDPDSGWVKMTIR